MAWSERTRSLPVCAHKPLWCSDRVVHDFIERNPDQSPVPLPHMTQLSNTETFPLVLKTQCVSRKPMGRWKKFKRKDCQIIFKLPKRGVPLFGFLCNFKLHTTLSFCPVVSLSFLHGSASLPVSFSVCLSVSFQPCSLTIRVWICSYAAHSPAHRWCWHLLWDPSRWQGARSFPESQGAAGDEAP